MAWATSVGAHWKKIEAEYNAEYAKLAYLDRPGYTVWDRMEAKADLQRRYFSRSSSHGVVNSPVETLTQSVELHFTSPRVESLRELDHGKAELNRQHNSRMAEYTREIRESCARILELLQEEIDATESTKDELPTSEETLPSMESLDEQLVDDFVGVRTSMVEPVTPIFCKPLPNQDAHSITGAFSQADPHFDNTLKLALPVDYVRSCKGSSVRISGMLITSSSSNFDLLLTKPPYPCVLTPTPPLPPPKPPDRSLRQSKMELQGTMDRSMSTPHPKPPDDNSGAVDTIILPSSVEMPVYPPSVCENVCVNDCVIFQLLLFMLFRSLPPVRHHSEKDHEQVILVVYLSVGSYAPISLDYGYTMNVFEKSEVYGYGVVLLIVLTCKHIDEKWKQDQHLQMVTYENREFWNVVFDKVQIHQQPPKIFMSLVGLSLHIIRMIQYFQEMLNPNKNNGTHVALIWFESLLQQHHLSLEPYHAHCCSCMNALSHNDAMAVVELFSFVIKFVVSILEDVSLAMELSLVFFMTKIKHDKAPVVKACTWGEIKDVKSSTINFSFSSATVDFGLVNLWASIIYDIGSKIHKNKSGHMANLGSQIGAARLEFESHILFDGYGFIHGISMFKETDIASCSWLMLNYSDLISHLARTDLYSNWFSQTKIQEDYYDDYDICIFGTFNNSSNGFVPRLLHAWIILKWSSGCVRKNGQVCGNEVVSKCCASIKLPTVAYIVNFIQVDLLCVQQHLAERTTISSIKWMLDDESVLMKTMASLLISQILTQMQALATSGENFKISTSIHQHCPHFNYKFEIIGGDFTMTSLLAWIVHFVLDVVTLINGCFVHKGSSQFNQWDPGGCYFVHWEGLLKWETSWIHVTWKVATTPQHYLGFNLEDKVDFKGEGNVMILNRESHVIK